LGQILNFQNKYTYLNEKIDVIGHDRFPQSEPNGLYTNGISTSATWILMTDAAGNITPTYVESEITVSQTKLDARLCEDWSIPSEY
jgi:hypothetical protein